MLNQLINGKAAYTAKQIKTEWPFLLTTDGLLRHNKDISLTAYNECSIYHHCQITSIDVEFQLHTCERLNLRHFEPTVCTANQAENGVATLLQKDIYRQTKTKAHVIKYSNVGDGNCLFRALSQAVMGSQDQHLLFRSSIVNHMLNNTAKNSMEQLFNHGTHHNKNYLINMAKPGVWGTEQAHSTVTRWHSLSWSTAISENHRLTYCEWVSEQLLNGTSAQYRLCSAILLKFYKS